MDTTKVDAPKVRVVFKAKDAEYSVPKTTILLPSLLSRYGLSQVVNHLLQLDKKIPFNFTINDQYLLKGSLNDLIEEQKLGFEQTLELEFFKSILPPKEGSCIPQDDWISDISISPFEDFAAITLYNGNVSMWDFKKLFSKNTSILPVRCVKWLSADNLLVGGLDRTVKLVDAKSLDILGIFKSHSASVESLAVQSDNKFVSGSVNGQLCIWSCNSEKKNSSKRQKISKTDIFLPVAKWSAHQALISSLICRLNSNAVYSTSWDSRFVEWDLVMSKQVETKTFQDPITCSVRLDQLFILGCTNGQMLYSDPRSNQLYSQKLLGHKNTLSTLTKLDGNYLFASGSYDASCKIWDIRSPTLCLYVVKQLDQPRAKVLATDYSQKHGLLIGGESKKLFRYTFD